MCGQTAIVTGANSGLGEAIAIALGRDGANVVVNYITHPEVAEEIAHTISESNPYGDAIAIRAATKGDIVMLMESICQEYASYKVRCNSIAPGAIATPINRAAWETPEALDKLHKLIPYKRIGLPEDIGSAAAWLASDESEYINATTIFVDGGMTCYPGFTENG